MLGDAIELNNCEIELQSVGWDVAGKESGTYFRVQLGFIFFG